VSDPAYQFIMRLKFPNKFISLVVCTFFSVVKKVHLSHMKEYSDRQRAEISRTGRIA
jgi:hypothetical protein